MKDPTSKASSALSVRYAELLRLREEVQRLEAAPVSVQRQGNASLQKSR